MEYERIPQYYITFIDCDNIGMEHTIAMEMQAGSTADDARRYFLSTKSANQRILVISVYDADYIDNFYPDNIDLIPAEVRRFLGDPLIDVPPTDLDEDRTWERPHDVVDEQPPDYSGEWDNDDDDDDNEGEEWKKLLPKQ
jgi:hypothetical protein